MKSQVQILREKRHFTQNELAEKSGLSLRTIQRIEAGNIPKGFTLKTLANVFETEPVKLLPVTEYINVDRAKLINLSSAIGLIIPFAGVIIPLILTSKTTDNRNKILGKSIISVQLLLSVVLSISLILSPFIQKGLALHFPLFLFPLLFILGVKLSVIILNGIHLNKRNNLYKYLKINYL